MKKKLLVILSILMLVCCTLFGTTVFGSAEPVIKTPGSLEIKKEYTANLEMMYYKNKVKGAVTVEFDLMPKVWNIKWGLGLFGAITSNPFSSKAFYFDNQNGTVYNPWTSGYLTLGTPILNYNEGYVGMYKMFQKVRIKMEVNAAGDVTFYAKSIESAATYEGTNAQQTEYVQITEQIKGIYAKEVASAEGCNIGLFFAKCDDSAYYYGLTATDTVATYKDDMTAKNLTDTYIVSDLVNGQLVAGNLVYTPAVVDEVEDVPVDTEGAIVFSSSYPMDGMINNKVKMSGPMTIDVDIDMSSFTNFGFGLMSTYGDASPYASKLFFMGAGSVYTPWAPSYLGSATAYLNGYTFSGRVTITMNVDSDGSVTLFADGKKILDTVAGIYADEIAGGCYFCMFARVGASNGYVYSVKIKDTAGNSLNKLDFAYDVLGPANFYFTPAVQDGLGSVLYWQQPTGQHVPVPTAEISVGNIPTSVNQNNKLNLAPVIRNMAETDVLTVTVNGEAIEDLEYVFEETGYYTVVYSVANENGEKLDEATVTIYVKATSTQNNAETNFNQGYFDGREFEATAGVAVKDNALYFKTSETALFTTVGYSENFILTYDVVSYVGGELRVVFGCIDDNEYAFEFLANGKVAFNGTEYEIGKNVYEILGGGNTVTIRVKVFAGGASLYVRASNESVENIEIAVVTIKDVIVVGKVGFGGVNAEFTADNVKFVSLTTVEEDNTYYPSDEELNPGDGESSTDTATSSSEGSTGKNGCKASVSMGGIMSLVALFGVALLKKRQN